MTVRGAKFQRGVALIALLAVIALAASWFLVKQLNVESGAVSAARKSRNAEMLNRAKQALIGYVAQQAALSGENNPGALPCPEAAAYYGDPAQEGIAGPNCALPKVGRFPWRTLGLDKLVDSTGEPLWYVVGPGWAYTSGSNTTINSNSTGQLTVDGTANDAVALIIAPGPAFSVPTATGCVFWRQTRPTTGTLDWRNYLECENATNPADSVFVTTGPSGSFNDQVVRITVADIMPAIEAAIAHRIEREIVPLLNSAYAAPNWGLTTWPPGPSPPGVADMVYPYPATFANPDLSNFAGVKANPAQGLLPLAHSETYPGSGVACTSGAADLRCDPTLVSWSNAAPSISYTGVGVTLLSTCSYAGPTDMATCTGTYLGLPTQITVSGPQSKGATSLRQLNAAALAAVTFNDPLNPGGPVSSSTSPTVVLNDDTFTISVTVAPPAPLGLAAVAFTIQVPGNATSDHALLDSRTSASTGWFLRNEWHKLTYYAVATGYTAVTAAPRACSTGTSCLTVTNVSPAGAQRAILILTGRSVNGASRPSPTPADYLEFGNANAVYEKRSVGRVLAMIYADTGVADTYNVVDVASLATGAGFQFKARYANTSPSTLNTPVTGTRGLVNADGSSLAAATIQANAAVQVTWDGTQFLLSKRPFNDRIVAISSNN